MNYKDNDVKLWVYSDTPNKIKIELEDFDKTNVDISLDVAGAKALIVELQEFVDKNKAK